MGYEEKYEWESPTVAGTIEEAQRRIVRSEEELSELAAAISKALSNQQLTAFQTLLDNWAKFRSALSEFHGLAFHEGTQARVASSVAFAEETERMLTLLASIHKDWNN
jgi:hypothetical protein